MTRRTTITRTRELTTTITATSSIPTTLSTQLHPSQAKAALETPSASATASTNAHVTKLEKSLQWHKTYHRNSAIAFSILAILIVGYIAFKIWAAIRRRKKAMVTQAAGGERKWYGRAAGKVAGMVI